MAVESPETIRDVQQSLLWSVAGVACFGGTIERRALRIRWNAALRNLYGLSASQSLRGGPLQNNRIDVVDQQRLQQACEALIETSRSLDQVFKVASANSVKMLRVVAQRLGDSNRIVGVLQQSDSTTAHTPPVSQDRWQSVGRLTLLDEVTSAIAHEINQPLAAITMFAQVGARMLAAPEPRLDKARQIFHDLSQQALRAGDLIHHMRSLVKRQPPNKTRLSVADLINGFTSLAETMARTHRVQFTAPTEFPAAWVTVDVAQMNQVLFILFHNALDAVHDVDPAQKSIAVSAQVASGKVVIAITDSGNGVSTGTAAQLFQPFFSTKENGTGLGLISVRNILETYGSRIEFLNLPTGGCRFSFALSMVEG